MMSRSTAGAESDGEMQMLQDAEAEEADAWSDADEGDQLPIEDARQKHLLVMEVTCTYVMHMYVVVRFHLS